MTRTELGHNFKKRSSRTRREVKLETHTCKLSPLGGLVSWLLRHFRTTSAPNSLLAASLLRPWREKVGLTISPMLRPRGRRFRTNFAHKFFWPVGTIRNDQVPVGHHSNARLKPGLHTREPSDRMRTPKRLQPHHVISTGLHHPFYHFRSILLSQGLALAWTGSASD